MTNNAAIAYNDLRRALVGVDTLTLQERGQLITRLTVAANKYPDETPAQRVMNDTLLHFREYVCAVIHEEREAALASTGTNLKSTNLLG